MNTCNDKCGEGSVNVEKKQVKVDRRVKYTKLILSESLKELLIEKPIEKITVKEICEKADVNRGTFYSHYSDQYDLYNDVVEEIILNALQYLGEVMDYEPHDTLNAAIMLYRYIRENHGLIHSLLKGRVCFATDTYESPIDRVIYRVYLGEIRKNVPNPRMLDMAYQFVAAANLTLIRFWLNTGMKESPEEMASIAMKLTAKGIGGLVEGAEEFDI